MAGEFDTLALRRRVEQWRAERGAKLRKWRHGSIAGKNREEQGVLRTPRRKVPFQG